MTRLKKAALVIVLLLLWLGVGFWVFQSFGPTPEENYQEWLVISRGGAIPSSKLEQWAKRFGIHYFEEARQRSDLRRTEELLADESYAVPVASFLDSGRRAGDWRVGPDPLSTWSPIKEALLGMIRRGDGEGLERMLSRTDAAGFATWDRTIARSAYQNRALDELALIVTEWRAFEQEHELDTSRAETLHQTSELYALSPADFTQALSATSDPSMKSLLDLVMQDLGISRENVYRALLAQWKADQFPESEWELAGQVARDVSLGSFRAEIFTWLAMGQETEKWREQHRAEIGVLMEDYQHRDPNFAKQCASLLVKTMTDKSVEVTSDWRLITGIILSKIDPEPNLKNWITDEVGPDFIWLCTVVNAEDMFKRALSTWNDSLRDRHQWMRDFLVNDHFRAACLFIEEETNEDVNLWFGLQALQNKFESFDDYLALFEEIVGHTDSPQTREFFRLAMMTAAFRDQVTGLDKTAVRAELVKAIERTNEVEAVNPHVLKQAILCLVTIDDELFQLGRPSFDKWRKGVEAVDVIDQVIRGEWLRDKVEASIWSDYFINQQPSPQELLKIADRLARWFQDPQENDSRKEVAQRLEHLFNTRSGDLEIVTWVLKKMNRNGQCRLSVPWMADRIEEFRIRYPEADHISAQQRIYETLKYELDKRSPSECLSWFGAILDDNRLEPYVWPYFFHQTSGYRFNWWSDLDTLRALEQSIASHPLRRWIARSLISGGAGPKENSAEVRARILESIREPWLVEVLNEYFDGIFDRDAFEHDMDQASQGAHRYFFENQIFPIERKFPKHPSGRFYEDGERFEYDIWRAEKLVNMIEKRENLGTINYEWYLYQLFTTAETFPNSSRLEHLATRLQNIKYEESYWSVKEKPLKNLKARALPFATGLTRRERLLINKALSVTERVWNLALLGDYATARELMEEEPDQLTYRLPTGIRAEHLSSPELAKFREGFSKGSELEIYVSIFLSDFRRSYALDGEIPHSFTSWPPLKSLYTKLEKELEELVLPFESTRFKSRELEQRTTATLGTIPGIGSLIPSKIAEMRAAPLRTHYPQVLAFLDFDKRLANGDPHHIRQYLLQLAKSGYLENPTQIAHMLKVIQHHLWRRALFGMEITDEQKKIINDLCFNSAPLNEFEVLGAVMPYPDLKSRPFPGLVPLHFTLELIDRAPSTPGNWTWEDFEGMDYGRYRKGEEYPNGLLSSVISTLAARGEDWDEEVRWSFIELFETPWLGKSEKASIVPLISFSNTHFIKKAEIEGRMHDFVSLNPRAGWNYLALWKLCTRFNLPEEAEYALSEMERFFEESPNLESALESYKKRVKSH